MTIWRSHSAAARRHVLRAFGQPATYTPSGGTATEINVLLDRNNAMAEGDIWQIQGATVQIVADSDDVPSLGPGDTFDVDGTTYVVNADPPPPGDGGLVAFPVQEK